MSKLGLSVAAGIFAVFVSMTSAQQNEHARSVSTLNYNSDLRIPSLTISDPRSFSFASAFDRLQTVSPDFLPQNFTFATTTATSRRAPASAALADDPSKEVSEVRRPFFNYAGGEIGFLYGRSTGKFAHDFEQGYIVGEVGNDHMQISAGAAYERVGGRDPRFGR